MHVQTVLMSTHEEWIKGIEVGLTPTVAAQKAGLAHTTVLRQLARGRLSADNVIAIAHAFNLKAGDALVQTGHIYPSDIKGAGVKQSLGLATNQQLLDEINKRVDPDSVRIFHGDGEITPRIDNSDLDSRREAKAAAADSAEVDDDAIIAGIAAGTEKYAAQKRTPPLEENFT